MPDETTILSLPLILPAQAQKHVTHNEAIAALDLIVQLTVIDRSLTAPPALSTPGDRHIVAAGATGAWAGQAGRIALFLANGWQFVQPLAGWRAHVLAEGQTAVFDGLAWKTPSEGPLSVTRLGVAATADATNRLAVSAPATLLNHAGGGHQLKLNKATMADTASLLFQTGFGGRAEMGTAGTDDFSIKVSPDGAAFYTGVEIDAGSGQVTLPQPVLLGGQAADPALPQNGTLWLNTTTGEVKVRSAGASFALGAGGGGVADGDKGDITVSGSGATWTIDAGAVSLPKLANLGTGRLIGRATAGTGTPEALTAAEARTLLNVANGATANQTDAALLNRANHTGAQAAATISDFAEAVDDRVAALLVPGANITLSYNDTANTLTVAAAGGGGGSPGGASGEIQWNNAGAFAGAADVEIEGGQLRLPAIATPTVPAAGGVKLFGRSVGGRLMPAFVGPSGLDSSVQPFLARNKVSFFSPIGNSTTVSASGLSLTATGTANGLNVATTNLHTRMRRLGWQVTTAATTAVVGVRHAAAQWTVGGNGAQLGGFLCVWRWGPDSGVANAAHRAFVGMRGNTAAPTDVNPSTLTLICGMGYDSADANIQFMHNDGAGTATKIDLGSSFPKPVTNQTEVYEVALFSPPGTAQVLHYEVTNLNTGVAATGTVTTDLPSTTQFLTPWSMMSVGGVSSVVGIAVMGLYIESDY